MADYHIRLLDVDTALLRTVVIDCTNDADAIEEMKLYAGFAPRMELWIGERQVRLSDH